MFENVDGRTHPRTHARTPARLPSYKLISELVISLLRVSYLVITS